MARKRTMRFHARVFRIGLAVAAIGSLSAAGGPPGKGNGDPPVREPGRLDYVLEPVLEGPDLRFRIELTFRGDRDGTTDLILPDEWAGQTRFYDGIENLRAVNAVMKNGSAEHLRVLEHAPGAAITIRYGLFQDIHEDLRGPGKAYRPILNAEFFHFIGQAVFVYPDIDEEEPRRVVLRWRNLPAGWALADSFGTGEKVQTLEIPIDSLRYAVFVGGDFRIRRIRMKGGPVFVAMRGEWAFSDEEFFQLIGTIFRVERRFWNDYDFPYYLITLIPTGRECCSYSGTGLTDSFATFISTDRGIDMMMKHLLAHELLHTWIGRKIRNTQTEDRPDALLYWFSEGFTDYYTRELLLRAGLITDREYLEDLNRRIFDYYTSPARNIPNSGIPASFWSDRHVNKVPYQRGDLLAGRWDAEIRAASSGRSSLDDPMRDLLRAAETDGEDVSVDTLRRILEPYFSRDPAADIEAFVRDGETVSPAGAVLGERAVLETVEMGPFDLGFDFEASQDRGRVSGVREDGPAHRAGLRDGQELKGFGIHWGDTSQPVAFTVVTGDGEETIRYLPVGETIPVPQYSLPAAGE